MMGVAATRGGGRIGEILGLERMQGEWRGQPCEIRSPSTGGTPLPAGGNGPADRSRVRSAYASCAALSRRQT